MATTERDSQLVLSLFDERWLIDLSAFSDPAPYVERLRHLWARGVIDTTGHDVVFRPLPAGADRNDPDGAVTAFIAERDDGSFPYAFSRAMTQALISRLTGSGLLLHAAGLASPEGGRGVVLVASSGTGKSTAARTLGRRFGYLSDELMRVDAEHRMQGLTKPLSIIVPGFPGGKDESSPDDVGLAAAPREAPELAAVVCLSRSTDAVAAVLEPISVHEFIAEVLPQSSSIWRGERPLHHLVEAGVLGGGPYRLRYSEIVEAEELIASLLSRDARAAVTHEWVGHLPHDEERWTTTDASVARLPEVLSDDAVVSRMPWTDAIESEGEISVLAGAEFSRIAGIAAPIWLACARQQTVRELREMLDREFGPHPEAVELMRAALAELASRRLVRLDEI
ncbi:ATP-binding protein [Microbacterium esteraromaticum]|uniref:ATP-binding protein n=1 Tax=Microbacterium esteraromaticum TaxID=57043 RepID=UPI001957E019|nr:ATP-binding protein [Microbacterium esteraromaticum]MBM7466692.1 hypothetical protein [Microbacterium esteraromaticum]